MENPVETVVTSLLNLGGRPPGNPAQISEVAGKFRQQAYRVQGTVAIVDKQKRIDYFEGPQADAYAGDIHVRKSQLVHLADALHEAANHFERMASRLAHDQVNWDQQLNRAVTGFPSAVVDQAKQRLGWR